MDRQIVIWQWDKDKIIKTVNVHVPATRLRTAPGSLLMLTPTGRRVSMLLMILAMESQLSDA